MVIGLFAFCIAKDKPDLTSLELSGINISLKLDLLFSSTIGSLDYNPFNSESKTCNHALVRKEENSFIVGFCTDDDKILALMENLCSLSKNCAFTCYYYWDNDTSNKLVLYEACNGERIKWFDVDLSFFNREAIQKLRGFKDFSNVVSIFDLFNEYHRYQNQIEDTVFENSQFLANSRIDWIVNPFENYEDKVSDCEYPNNAGEDDLPF